MVRGTSVRKSDIVFSFVLFFIYIAWLILNDVDLYKRLKEPLKIFRENETGKTPMISIIHRAFIM